MRLGEIFRYEVGYQLRRLPTWLYFAGILGLVFIIVTDTLQQEAKSGGNLNTNAPFLISYSMVIISMMALAITAALFGDAAARDAEARMHPLFYTTPVTKLDYLGGRFLGAFTVNALLLAAVPAGVVLGELFYLERANAGPFRLTTYLQPFFGMMMPNLFVSAAIVFTLAALTRRPMAAYGGGVLLFLGSILTEEGVAEQLAWRNVVRERRVPRDAAARRAEGEGRPDRPRAAGADARHDRRRRVRRGRQGALPEEAPHPLGRADRHRDGAGQARARRHRSEARAAGEGARRQRPRRDVGRASVYGVSLVRKTS